jgi:hypothetical protein
MEQSEQIGRRIAYFRRAFSRGIGFNPNASQRAAMDRAAALVAFAEFKLADPTTTHNDRIKACLAADRAQATMRRELELSTKRKPLNEFDAYALARQRQKAATA